MDGPPALSFSGHLTRRVHLSLCNDQLRLRDCRRLFTSTASSPWQAWKEVWSPHPRFKAVPAPLAAREGPQGTGGIVFWELAFPGKILVYISSWPSFLIILSSSLQETAVLLNLCSKASGSAWHAPCHGHRPWVAPPVDTMKAFRAESTLCFPTKKEGGPEPEFSLLTSSLF